MVKSVTYRFDINTINKNNNMNTYNKKSLKSIIVKDFKKNRMIYLMALPVLAYYVIFSLWPNVWCHNRFQRFHPAKKILGSHVGFQWFRDFSPVIILKDYCEIRC